MLEQIHRSDVRKLKNLLREHELVIADTNALYHPSPETLLKDLETMERSKRILVICDFIHHELSSLDMRYSKGLFKRLKRSEKPRVIFLKTEFTTKEQSMGSLEALPKEMRRVILDTYRNSGKLVEDSRHRDFALISTAACLSDAGVKCWIMSSDKTIGEACRALSELGYGIKFCGPPWGLSRVGEQAKLLNPERVLGMEEGEWIGFGERPFECPTKFLKVEMPDRCKSCFRVILEWPKDSRDTVKRVVEAINYYVGLNEAFAGRGISVGGEIHKGGTIFYFESKEQANRFTEFITGRGKGVKGFPDFGLKKPYFGSEPRIIRQVHIHGRVMQACGRVRQRDPYAQLGIDMCATSEDIRGVLTTPAEGEVKALLMDPRRRVKHDKVLSKRLLARFKKFVGEKDFRFVALGGAGEVGRSCHLIKFGGKLFVFDCGINVKAARPWEKFPALDYLSAVASEVAGVFITHPHYDHCAALPYLAAILPEKVEIYCTPETTRMLEPVLDDIPRVAAKRMAVEPFLPKHMKWILSRIEQVKRGAWIKIGRSIRAKFVDAGHVAGSASVLLEGPEEKILYTGDIGPGFSRVSGTPEPEPADLVITEATYWGGKHPPREEEEKQLIGSIKRALGRKGRVLIPAFAVGRAQEIKALIKEYQKKKELPKVPLRVFGLADGIDKALKGSKAPGENAEEAVHIEDVAKDTKPSITIASSGMLVGGASAYLFQHVAREPNSLVALVGYQDEDSPGRKLQTQGMGEKCEVQKFGLSAHADSEQLLDYLQRCKPKQVIMVHLDGDGGAMRGRLSKLGASVLRPENLELVSANGEVVERFTNYWGPRGKAKEGCFACLDCKAVFRSLRGAVIHGYNNPVHPMFFFRGSPKKLSVVITSSKPSRYTKDEAEAFVQQMQLKGIDIYNWGSLSGETYLSVFVSPLPSDELIDRLNGAVTDERGEPALTVESKETIRLRSRESEYPIVRPMAKRRSVEELTHSRFEKIKEMLKVDPGPEPHITVTLDPTAWARRHLEGFSTLGFAVKGGRMPSVAIKVSPEALEDESILTRTIDHELAHYIQLTLNHNAAQDKVFAEGFATWVQEKMSPDVTPDDVLSTTEWGTRPEVYLKGLAHFRRIEQAFGSEECVRVALKGTSNNFVSRVKEAHQKLRHLEPSELERRLEQLEKAERIEKEGKAREPRAGVEEVPKRNIILVGTKSPIEYVMEAMEMINKGSNEIIVKGRGEAISRAVDVAEITRNRFITNLTVKDIRIGTERVQLETGSAKLSTIEITLGPKPLEPEIPAKPEPELKPEAREEPRKKRVRVREVKKPKKRESGPKAKPAVRAPEVEPSVPGPTREVKYCYKCGAKMSVNTKLCPLCRRKQPERGST